MDQININNEPATENIVHALPPNGNGQLGQSMSPISISATNSVVNTPNLIGNKTSQMNISAPVLEIDQVMRSGNGNMIGVDMDNTKTNFNATGNPTIPSNLPVSPVKELVEDKERIKRDTIHNIEETLDRMENTRLELAPMLLDIIEQVKNGEVSIKDVVNSCGRLRMRINKLHEDRTVVFDALSSLEKEFNCSTNEKEQAATRIANKEQCFNSIADLIASRNM